MSYLVLARKYRPLSFEAMVGQGHVVQALANALTRQRLHHAYLFTGTRGVGKTTVSRILAKSLNCTGPDGLGGITARPCGVCDACKDIDNGRFVDYVELDAASNRGVEEITQLLDQSVYKPVLGRFKVYMIDEVHMLSNHAFNAMLKTLEEPPDYLKFVLATTDPQKVPATVLSRCLQFNLRPMAVDTMQEHLAQVLVAEAITAEPAALRLLARAARGSMRDALSLADQAIAFGAGSLSEAGIRQMLGAVDRGHAVRLLDALAEADGAALLAAAEGLRALGLSAVGTLEEMAELLQQMAVLLAVPTAAHGDAAEQAEATRLATLFGADEIALLYSMCLHGRAEIALAPDEYGGLVMILLRMLAFRPVERLAAAGDTPAGASRPARPLQASQVAKAQVALGAPAAARPAASAAGSRSAIAAAGAGAVGATRASPHARPVTPAPGGRTASAQATHGVPTALGAGLGSDHRATAGDGDLLPPWLNAPELDAGLAAAPEPELALWDAGAEQAAPGGPPVEPQAGGSERLQGSALGGRWADAVAALIARGSISALVRELAWQAECVEIVPAAAPGATAVWRLRVEREMLRAPSHSERLQAALSDWLDQSVRIETEAGATRDTPALRASAERERRQRAAEATIAGDPLVQVLLSEYKTARIVPGSVRPL